MPRHAGRVVATLGLAALATCAAPACATTFVSVLEDTRPRSTSGSHSTWTSDGGYLVGGKAWIGGGSPQIVLAALDGAGNMRWYTVLGTPDGVDAQRIVEACDGYLLLGTGYGLDRSSNNPQVMFVDRAGRHVWTRHYVAPLQQYSHAVKALPDGGLAFAGYTTPSSYSAQENAMLLVTAADGSIVRQAWFDGESQADRFQDVAMAADGRTFLAGMTDQDPGASHGWLIVLQPDGSVAWSREYAPAGGGSNLQHVVPTPDGGAVIFGFGNDYAPNDESLWVAKVSDGGDIERQQAFTDIKWNEHSEHDVEQAPDGRVVFVGSHRPDALADRAGAVLVFDEDANLLLSRRIKVSPLRGEQMEDVEPTPDGGFLVTASTWHDVYGDDILVAKLDERLLADASCALVQEHAFAPEDLVIEALPSRVTTGPMDFVLGTRDWPVTPIQIGERPGCPVAGCVPAVAAILSSEPGRVVCVGTGLSFEGAAGGDGTLTVEWDFDYECGQFTIDATGLSGDVTYPTTGERTVALRVTDACGDGAQDVIVTVEVRVIDCSEPPGEVSDVRAGAVPLRAWQGGRLIFEERADATAYNVNMGAIGSWWGPSGASTNCAMRQWNSLPGGWAEVSFVPPLNTWLIVTASNGAGEGPPGRDSFDVARPLPLTCGASN